MSVQILVGDCLERLRGLPSEYAEMARKRIEGDAPMFSNVEVQAC